MYDKKCIHADEKDRCTHDNHIRIGPLAPMIGERPACVLLCGGSCADYKSDVNTTYAQLPESWRKLLGSSDDGSGEPGGSGDKR